MTTPLNYSTQPHRILTGRPVSDFGFVGNGAIARLPSEHFDRYLHRLVLSAPNTGPSDIGTPINWNSLQATVDFYLMFGALGTAQNVIDFSHFGDLNTAEYAVPILVPKDTEIWCFWNDVLAASAPKFQIVMSLTAV